MSDARPDETKVYRECYHNKFSAKPQCGAVARWRGKGAGNSTDGWTWCDEHVTAAVDYREPLHD